MLVSVSLDCQADLGPFPHMNISKELLSPSTLSQRISDFYLGTCSQDLLLIMPGIILGAQDKAVNKKCFVPSRSLYHSHSNPELQTKHPLSLGSQGWLSRFVTGLQLRKTPMSVSPGLCSPLSGPEPITILCYRVHFLSISGRRIPSFYLPFTCHRLL